MDWGREVEMPKRESTNKRHETLRRTIYDRAKKLWNAGIRDYVKQACLDMSKQTGYAATTLEDIYYGRH